MGRRTEYKKRFYKINEAASLLGVRTSVIRFWENEFCFETKKTPGGQRIYSVSDVKRLIKIKYLLYEEKYTIEGAKKRIGSRQLKLPMEEMMLKDALRYIRKEVEKLISDE